MPGVAQIWLTDDELRVIEAAFPCLVAHAKIRLPGAESLMSKVRAAREGIACPAREENEA